MRASEHETAFLEQPDLRASIPVLFAANQGRPAEYQHLGPVRPLLLQVIEWEDIMRHKERERENGYACCYGLFSFRIDVQASQPASYMYLAPLLHIHEGFF